MASESERRNAKFKHGGGPSTQARRQEYRDAPWNASEEDAPWAQDVPVEPDVYAEPVDPRSEAEKNAGASINVLDMITPSWGDEIVAGAMTPLANVGLRGKNKSYADEVAQARKIQQRYRENEEWDSKRNLVSSGLGLVGGAGPAIGLFKGGQFLARIPTGGVAASSMLGRAAQAAAGLGLTGAAYSEIGQAGEAEGGPQQRLEAMQAGGLSVPAIGATFGVAAGGLGAGGSRIAQRVGQGFRSGKSQAARYLAEKLLGAGQDVNDLAVAHAQAAKTGKPVTLGDVGPQGIKDAGGAAGRTPGPGRETAQGTLVPRQEGQVGRVSDDVAEAVGGKPGTFTKTVEEISAQRAIEAKPLYEAAMHPRPLISKKIREIVNRPSGKSAMDRGLKIARDEGIPDNELFDAQGNYTTKALHYMKMGLDDMIESAQRSGDNAAARAYTIMKNELLGEVDRLNPAYAKARKVFAGHAANQRALESGRKAINAHPDQIRSEMSNMSQAEQEMYRRGFAQRVIEDVEKATDQGNAARRIFGNTVKRERIRAVLGDEKFAQLAERLGVEESMYASYRRTNVGSETAERMSAQGDFEEFIAGQTPEMAAAFSRTAISGNISHLMHTLGLNGIASLLRGLSQRARGHIAKMLFSHDPNDVQQALKAIAKEYAAAKRFNTAQDAILSQSAAQEKARAAGGVAGNVAYGYSPVKPFGPTIP